TGQGITLSCSGCTAKGNLIGTNASGSAALPNSSGIVVVGANKTIGGTTAAARNVISGNTSSGILFLSGSNVTIQGNYMGLGASDAGPGKGWNGIPISNTTRVPVGGTG